MIKAFDINKSKNIFSELELFKRELETDTGAPEDLVEWWRKKRSNYPNLYQIARNILSCQATSAPSERMFSKARFFWRPDRNKIEANKFRKAFCLSNWAKIQELKIYF